MKYDRKESKPVPVIPVSRTGACIGDKVLFSSHNPVNIKRKPYMNGQGVTFDKLYTIDRILDGLTYIIDDHGSIAPWGGDEHLIGQYDIIERAPVKPPFEPVILTLETQQEINLLASLLGKLSTSIKDEFDAESSYAVYSKLDDAADSNRPRFETFVIRK